ncbi:histidine--tRNA ligase [Nesterenkonia populi]
MARSASLSGYLELLPDERLVEIHMLDTLRRVFESHGFANIESRAVETVDTLLNKGEVDKEVYTVSRIHDDGSEKSRLALHFDLTVPFARYVVENAGHLAFPFRRYQIQKVWRGERPQAGRFREFTQADVDIVGEGALPFRADVELAMVMARALQALEVGEFTLQLNNRKLSTGFYTAIGLGDAAAVLRIVDKLDKIGADRVQAELSEAVGAAPEQAQKALALAQIRTRDAGFAEQVRQLVSDAEDTELLEEGLAELSEVMTALNQQVPGVAVADLSIARGLDYYTGTVYETVLTGYEQLGSICSGGRYESLASKGRRAYPGVGLSIGVTRLLSALLDSGALRASRSVPTAVYVTLRSDEDWSAATAIAEQLRTRGISAEVAYSAEKFGKQIKYADRRGIPFVWFTDEEGRHEVKDIRSGEQSPADPQTWSPSPEDLAPRIIRG